MKNKKEYPIIIVTSGGTSVPIDSVRKITNKSSGQLGAMITNQIFKAFKNKVNVIYIHSHKAMLPKKNKRLTLVEADDVFSVQSCLHKYITNNKISAVVHSMAISDYVLDYTTSSTNFFKFIESKRKFDPKRIVELLWDVVESPYTFKQNKIASDSEDLLIHLVKAPKIISYIKDWDPNITLVGFKLLSNPALYQVKDAVVKLFETAKCDYVLYNDLYQINEKHHAARLFSKDSSLEVVRRNYGEDITSNVMQSFETKKEIAKGLAKTLYNDINNKKETK